MLRYSERELQNAENQKVKPQDVKCFTYYKLYIFYGKGIEQHILARMIDTRKKLEVFLWRHLQVTVKLLKYSNYFTQFSNTKIFNYSKRY